VSSAHVTTTVRKDFYSETRWSNFPTLRYCRLCTNDSNGAQGITTACKDPGSTLTSAHILWENRYTQHLHEYNIGSWTGTCDHGMYAALWLLRELLMSLQPIDTDHCYMSACIQWGSMLKMSEADSGPRWRRHFHTENCFVLGITNYSVKIIQPHPRM